MILPAIILPVFPEYAARHGAWGLGPGDYKYGAPTALGSRRNFAYFAWFAVKLRPSAFIIHHSSFIIST